MGTEQAVLLAEVLSPSQVTQFLNCPAKWMFRYLLDTRDPGTAATALGKAVHETIVHNFRQKQETARDLPLGECLEFFQNVLGKQLDEIRLQKGEHPWSCLNWGQRWSPSTLRKPLP